MANEINQTGEKTALLKDARLELLRLHKLLVDIERHEYEKNEGQISSGQFLNLLLNEDDFQWLRKFSALIVEIDEMFDLDDGFSDEMVEKHLAAIRDIIELKTPDKAFNEKFQKFLESQPPVAAKNNEIKNMLSK